MDPRLRMALVVVLLSFASLASAGCVEDADSQGAPSIEGRPTSTNGHPGAVAPEPRQVFFPVTLPNETHWWNGTFQAQENQDTVGDIAEEAGIDAGAYHHRDVSDLIPIDTLVQVVIEIEAELAQGDIDIWLEVPVTSHSRFRAEIPYGGWSRVEYNLARTDDAPIGLVVRHDEMEPTAFDYTLSMEVIAEPERLPDGFPAGISLGDDDVLEVVPADEGPPTVAVWAPDGTFLGRLPTDEGSVRIEAAALQGAGTYIILREAGEGSTRLYHTDPTQAEVTFPALRWETGDVHTANGPVSWTWTADTAPAVMMLAFHMPSTQTGDLKAKVAGPDGDLLALETEVTLSIGYSRTIATAIGAEGLLPGEYTFTVTPGQMAPTGPMEAQRVTAFIDPPS